MHACMATMADKNSELKVLILPRDEFGIKSILDLNGSYMPVMSGASSPFILIGRCLNGSRAFFF